MSVSTRNALLHAAERLVRSRGYSAFSYADLADEVGITKASIHHHFPTKADLGNALVDNYVDQIRELMTSIESTETTSVARLRAYGSIYVSSVRQGSLCLCGILSAEAVVLPRPLQDRLRMFFRDQISWLERVLAEGLANKELRLPHNPVRSAEHFLSTLQGSTLVGWAMRDHKIISRAVDDALTGMIRA
ncbi:MAG TPA: TetR/AcrR family transcriptional regulator [Alphaproteobacteria bacterium]|nr:TetR/AcrR family transcriptional regulator [Alphaproteobacteria bacterium]